MGQSSEVVIRPIRDDERSQVQAMMHRSFPLVERYFFGWTPHVLVAEQADQLLGAIVLKLFTLPRQRQVGSISWVFTAPEVRGLGVGQRLVEAGFDVFEREGCDEILVSVEGFNTSSSKLFATRGFGILSPGAQFRRYGLATLVVWTQLVHHLEAGYFLWARPAPTKADNPSLQWWGAIAANSTIGFLALWRMDMTGAIAPLMAIALPLVLVMLFGVRYLGMKLVAQRQGLAVRFRAWESGFPLSAVIALASGALYPIPGSVYPITHQWRYREWLPKLGRMALAGTLPVVLLVAAASVLLQLSDVPLWLMAGLEVTRWLGKPLIIFDIVLPFFPFSSFNGRLLWDWNKVVWGLMAVAAIGVVFV